MQRELAVLADPEFLRDVPPGARSKGMAIAYLHEKYGFKHTEIALLCASRDEFPVQVATLDREQANIRKAYSSLPRDRKRFVRHVLAARRKAHTS